jgi:2-polyprenyl-3-methyl-5-hydroxy-6-metoxy-1,4-benzoquinol methylase
MFKTQADDKIRSYECPTCELCGSGGHFLYQDLNDRLFGASGEWNLKQCNNNQCQLVWLDPMPLEADLGKAYATYFTHSDRHSSKPINLNFILFFYRVFQNIAAYFLKTRVDQDNVRNMWLTRVENGSLLEVGCGAGEFLSRMQLSGWQVEGVDFDPQAAITAYSQYGLKIHVGTLNSVEFPQNSFDAIVMHHVIEHLPDTLGMFRECYRILKPGGILVTVTPNVNSWGHEVFKENWLHLDPPRHLYLFSQGTLGEFARKAGFGKVETQTVTSRAIGDFIASQEIQKMGFYSGSKQNKLVHLKSALMQYYYLAFKKHHDLGEELILLAHK